MLLPATGSLDSNYGFQLITLENNTADEAGSALYGRGIAICYLYNNNASQQFIPVRLLRPWPDYFLAGRWSRSQTAEKV